MTQHLKAVEGTVSPKHQITIPAVIREALGLRPGDKVEFMLDQDNVLELRVKRPKPSEVIAALLQKYDAKGIQSETENDAVSALRRNRWDDEL